MSTLSIKEGVQLTQLHRRLVLALPTILAVMEIHGSDTTITSGRDGVHSEGSLHYTFPGRAIDLRIWHLDDAAATVKDLQLALGPDFDVVLEDTHIHVELDPAWVGQ